MPCLGSPDTAALEVLMRTAGEEAAAAGGSYTSLASLQHLTAPAGMGLVFDAAHEQGTDLAALENLEQILGTIDEAPSSRASSRPDSRSVRPTPPPQAAAAAAAARAGSRQQLLPSSRGSVGGGGGVLPPLRGASGVGGRPPPQRRVSELYSPLDRLLGKKMAAVAAGGGGEVAAAAEACDLGSLDGRRRFVCSMRRWAECEGREVSPAAAGLTAAAHPPALPAKREQPSALQAIQEKQGKLRGEIASIQNRSHERLTQRKTRVKKKAAGAHLLPPLKPQGSMKEGGRGQLLHQICRTYQPQVYGALAM